jgi:pimeloyl-ACP methyl ester carboxylesterase
VAVLLTLAVLFTGSYAAISIYIGPQIQVEPHLPIYATPASLGLQYKDVTFPSREDQVQLKGWFIPGVLPNGHLTAQRTIIMLHGQIANRAAKDSGLLRLSGDLARRGFAILAFDMRGNGESPAAARSSGLFEQRDALGAVDFLRSGPLPYPELGRPQVIAGWGNSLGGATLIFAAAREPAIGAIVSDCAFADFLPIMEREFTSQGHYPPFLLPGGLVAAQVLYGVDYYHTRPADVIAEVAPRPIFLIHGASDPFTPPSDMAVLAAAARSAPNANVQTWLVPGATHGQSYNVAGNVYVDHLVAFYTVALGPDTSGS